MDNCPNLDSFIKVYTNRKTLKRFQYCKTIERFLANFNNGHTDIFDIPLIISLCCSTVYKDSLQRRQNYNENIENNTKTK